MLQQQFIRLLFLLLLSCDAADYVPGPEPSRISLVEMVVDGKLVSGVGPGGALQPARLVFARLDAPDWLRYFRADGSGRYSPVDRPSRRASYHVDWSVSVLGSDENILVNNSASGKFIATSPDGHTLGPNHLPTGAFAFFVGDKGLSGGDYLIRASLSDGGDPPKALGEWQREFRLTASFAFPTFFRFKVRGVVIDLAQHGADKAVYPAPNTGTYPVKLSTDGDGVELPHKAEATVFLTSAATSSKRDVFYYDFVSLTKGYTIEYLSAGAAKVEAEVKADPKDSSVKPTPKVLVTQIVRRSSVDVEADHLPAPQADYALKFHADAGTTASGRVSLLVRDQQGQHGTLTVYLRALKQ